MGRGRLDRYKSGAVVFVAGPMAALSCYMIVKDEEQESGF